jgi:hypothetical protein
MCCNYPAESASSFARHCRRTRIMQRAFVRDLSDEVRLLSVHDKGECFDLIAKVE